MGMDKKLDDIPIILFIELMQDLRITNLKGMQFQLQSEKKNKTSKIIYCTCIYIHIDIRISMCIYIHIHVHVVDFNNSFLYKLSI